MRVFNSNRAFTMIELIFVIVVLGIVSSIGAQMIANVYKNYVLQRAQHSASIKSELAVLQIANRLRYAIPGTVFRIRSDGTYEGVDEPFSAGYSSSDYIGLQWVAYDGDSFETSFNPGWSGFCDVTPSTKDKMITPGSNLDLTDTVIQNLSGGDKSIADAYIYFPDSTSAYAINETSDGNISFDTSSDLVEEHYKLAWTSYALVVEGGDLYLYYDIAATPKADYTTGKKRLMMKSITTFKFRGEGDVVRFKVCKEENIGDTDKNITSCKEKAVF